MLIIVKILNLYFILSCTHLYHFFLVSIYYLQCIHCFLQKQTSWHAPLCYRKAQANRWHPFYHAASHACPTCPSHLEQTRPTQTVWDFRRDTSCYVSLVHRRKLTLNSILLFYHYFESSFVMVLKLNFCFHIGKWMYVMEGSDLELRNCCSRIKLRPWFPFGGPKPVFFPN